MRKILHAILLAGFLTASVTLIPAQSAESEPDEKVSAILGQIIDSTKNTGPAGTEDRWNAYVKVLEGQRHSWQADRARTQTEQVQLTGNARRAFIEAIRLDISLAEAYTALGELETARRLSNENVAEGIKIAEMALAVDQDNFGANRLLARLYSLQSRIGQMNVDEESAKKAVTHWKKIVGLDTRNAEGWAFLSLFYEHLNRTEEQIEALRNWVSATPPADGRFFSLVMGPRFALTPENASLRLGTAYLETGKYQEAVVLLSSVVADQPQNAEAIKRLEEAIFSSENINAADAEEPLQQAVYANPSNSALVSLLAEIYYRKGDKKGARSAFAAAIDKLLPDDISAAAEMQLSLGDLLARNGEVDEAVKAYKDSTDVYGVNPARFNEREAAFLKRVLEKKISALRSANRSAEAIGLLEKYTPAFSRNDQFIDRHLVMLYRETGNRAKALETVSSLRKLTPGDIGLMRLHATMLAESGRVEEGVELIKQGEPDIRPEQIGGGGRPTVTGRDTFSDHLFISELYTRAGDHKKASEAAAEALTLARGRERQQIAKLTIATAHFYSGDFASAEKAIREVLTETPGNPIALNNLGYFLVERNERLDEAVEMITRAVKVDPTNPSYLDSLGWAYFKLGKYDEAEKYLKEAAGFDPGSATIQEHLGDVYEKLGKNELARSSWEKALNLAENEKDITRLRGKLGDGSR